MAWRWLIDKLFSALEKGRNSLSSTVSGGIDSGSQTRAATPAGQVNPRWAEEVAFGCGNSEAGLYSNRNTPTLVWIEDGGKRCPALVLTGAFSETMREAVDRIRDIATHKGRVRRQRLYTSDLRERVLIQLKKLENAKSEACQTADNADAIWEMRDQQDSLMQTLVAIDDEATRPCELPPDLSRRRDQVDSRIFSVFNDIFERAGLVEPYDVPIGDPEVPIDLGLLELMEENEMLPREQDQLSVERQSGQTSARESMTGSDIHAQEEEISVIDLFNNMMEQRQHLQDLREQLEDQSARVEIEQTKLDDMVLRLEANDVDCPTGGDSTHMEDFFRDLILYRDMARNLQSGSRGGPIYDLDFEEADKRYRVCAARLDKAGFDCQTIEGALDRQTRGFEAISSVIGSYDELRRRERQLAGAIERKQTAIGRLQAEHGGNDIGSPNDDDSTGLSGQGNFARGELDPVEHEAQDLATEAELEHRPEDADESSDAFQEEQSVDDSASDQMAYYDDDVSRWEILCRNAQEEFEQALQDLDEAGFCCPDLSGRDKLPVNHNLNFSGQGEDDGGNIDTKINMIESLPSLADIAGELQQVHQWLYQLGPFAEKAEDAKSCDDGVAGPEVDNWESQSVHPSESESLRSPDFTEKTDQDTLRQWLDFTERFRLKLAQSSDDLLDGVGALFEEIDDDENLEEDMV